MPTTRMTVRQVMSDPSVERAVTTTAQMYGLAQAVVATMVHVGLPLMAHLAAANPDVFQRMHAATLVTTPEPLQDFYVLMSFNPSIRQSAVDDYKATYGSLFDLANREAARQAGITDGQARDVMATILPAVNSALVAANDLDDADRFAQQLTELCA